jgi:hypothetical protein
MCKITASLSFPHDQFSFPRAPRAKPSGYSCAMIRLGLPLSAPQPLKMRVPGERLDPLPRAGHGQPIVLAFQ